MTTAATDLDDPFDALRPRLFGIAYRMLGVRADAEDVLQDAWLRWHGTERAALQSAEAWLVTVVTRLSIDRLRAAKTEREHYSGWWLPEPLVEVDDRSPEAIVEWTNDLSVAFLYTLERLAPEERAAFLLRQVFDHDYAEIAAMLDKSEAACRQLVHRAGVRVREQRPRFEVPSDTHRTLLEKFVAAAQSGRREAVKELLAADAQALSDGGGKVRAVSAAMHGADRIANLYWAIGKRSGEHMQYRIADINGEPGLLRYYDGRLESATAFVFDAGRIAAIYAIRNPDKLARIAASLQTI